MTTRRTGSRRGVTAEELTHGALFVGRLLRGVRAVGGHGVHSRIPFRLSHVARIEVTLSYARVEFIDRRTPQTIRVSWTRCHFGGLRPWFHCLCGRRVGNLLPGLGGFYCRVCVGSPLYACQAVSAGGRKSYAVGKLRLQLGGSASPVDPVPSKPPRMHNTTFQRRMAKLQSIEAELSPRLKARPPDYKNLVVSVGF